MGKVHPIHAAYIHTTHAWEKWELAANQGGRTRRGGCVAGTPPSLPLTRSRETEDPKCQRALFDYRYGYRMSSNMITVYEMVRRPTPPFAP